MDTESNKRLPNPAVIQNWGETIEPSSSHERPPFSSEVHQVEMIVITDAAGNPHNTGIANQRHDESMGQPYNTGAYKGQAHQHHPQHQPQQMEMNPMFKHGIPDGIQQTSTAGDLSTNIHGPSASVQHPYCVPLQAFLMFVVLIIGTQTSIGVSAFYLAQQKLEQQQQQNTLELQLFQLLSLQLLFQLSALFVVAEVVVRVTSNDKGHLGTKQQGALFALFVVTAILVVAIPALSQRSKPDVVTDAQRGNCSSEIPWAILDDNENVCPDLLKNRPLFVQLNQDYKFEDTEVEGGKSTVVSTYDRVVSMEQVLELLTKLGAYYSDCHKLHWCRGDLGVVAPVSKAARPYVHLFYSPECVYNALDYFCLNPLPMCIFDTCEAINVTTCSIVYVSKWLRCVSSLCEQEEGCDASSVATAPILGQALSLVTRDFLGEESASKLPDAWKIYDLSTEAKQHKFLVFIWSKLQQDIKNYDEILQAYDEQSCNPRSMSQRRRNKVNNSSSGNDALSCNPSITKITISNPETELNSRNLLLVVTAVLSVPVGVWGRKGMLVPRPQSHALFNCVIGMFTTIMIFIGGLNIDRFQTNSKNILNKPRFDLVVWSAIYYSIAAVSFRHSMFMLLPRQWRFEFFPYLKICWKSTICRLFRCKAQTKNEKKKKKKKKKCFKLNRFYKTFIKAEGRYFIVYMWLREFFQMVQQLYGISNSIKETEAFSAFLFATVISLNIILLPSVYLITVHCSGPTLAVALSILVNAMIDRVYIFFSVFLRQTETAVNGQDLGEIILRHSLTLLPALAFIRKRNVFERLETQYKKNDRQSRQTIHETRGTLESYTRSLHKSRRSVRRLSMIKHKKSKRNIATIFIGVMCITAGFIFGGVTIARYINIKNTCYGHLGVLESCASPRLYYKSGFFIGEPSCALEDITRFDCQKGALGQTTTLKTIQKHVYASLTNLSRIDLSENTHLTSLPEGLIHLPRLKVLNASHNRMLSNVPFLLCKKTANIEIDLSNTLFSQHVNWSGQIIRQRNTLDAEFPEISQTCTKSIQHAQTLDLSSNNLSCPTKLSYQDPFYAYDHLGETSAIITGKVFVENFDIYIPENEKLWRKIWHASTCTFYQMVSNMRDLSYLDLRNNSIRTLEYSLFAATDHIVTRNNSLGGSGGINIEECPVTSFIFSIAPTFILDIWLSKIMATSATLPNSLVYGVVAQTATDAQLMKYELHRYSHMKYLDLQFTNLSDVKLIQFPKSLVWLDLDSKFFNIETLNETLIHLEQMKNLLLIRFWVGVSSNTIYARTDRTSINFIELSKHDRTNIDKKSVNYIYQKFDSTVKCPVNCIPIKTASECKIGTAALDGFKTYSGSVNLINASNIPSNCVYSGSDVHYNSYVHSGASSFPSNWGSTVGVVCRECP